MNNLANRSIGGFFGLENPERHNDYHEYGEGLSNGRSCLNVILKNSRPNHVYVPYYCCDSLLAPLKDSNIRYSFYSIDETLAPTALPKLLDDELFVYINYFGIKRDVVKYLIDYFGDKLVVDNTHDYFERGYSKGYSFNSARKFFGVPDGAYLYMNTKIKKNSYPRNQNFIADHLIMKLDRRQDRAYEMFKVNESMQSITPYEISFFSQTVLEGIDYGFVKNKRRENYDLYHKQLCELNRLSGIELKTDEVPFCYPLLTNGNFDLTYFHSKHVFIPVFWTEVLHREESDFKWEKEIVSKILPLPIDHRYGKEEITFVIDLIKKIE